MILKGNECSEFERCPRLPGLARQFEPPRYPIRHAVKRYFESGIRSIQAGNSPADTVWKFTDEAAGRGYVYGEGEPYTLAQDFACWLDGALRLVQESGINREPLRLYQSGNDFLHVDGWVDASGAVHIYRASSSLGSRILRWPELAVLAHEPEREITIHVYCLPQARGGRLLSPLSLGYQHPKIQNASIRLSRRDKEASSFKSTWKKVGRWECPDISWAEWREGIDADQCMDLIQEEYQCPMLDEEEIYAVKGDLERMAVVMQKPDIWPRYREACQGCIYQGLCHGNREQRKEYIPLRDDES